MNIHNSLLQASQDLVSNIPYESNKLFSGRKIDLYAYEEVDAEGNSFPRDLVIHPGASVILPLIDNGLLLIRNFRFAVGESLWELPAGTLEKGETPLSTAGRELTEETGYRAAKISPLTAFYSSPGFSNEVLYAFLAEDLTFVGQNLNEGEKIEVQLFSWPEVINMLRRGEIHDAKSMTSLLFYQLFYRNMTGA